MCFTVNKRPTCEAFFFLYYIYSCRGISFSDPLSGNVCMGVENLSRPSKTLMEMVPTITAVSVFKRIGGVVLI